MGLGWVGWLGTRLGSWLKSGRVLVVGRIEIQFGGLLEIRNWLELSLEVEMCVLCLYVLHITCVAFLIFN